MDILFLKNYIDRHKNQPFLVCGLGTSLDQYPVDFYQKWKGVTIGVNEIEDLFIPDYRLNVNSYHDKDYYALLDKQGQEIRYEYTSPSDTVDIEKTGRLTMCGSGIVPAISAAYQMGAREIFIIGVDFKKNKEGRIYWSGCRKPEPDYYQLSDEKNPETQATLRCIRHMAKEYRNAGVEIYNLSENSLLGGL